MPRKIAAQTTKTVLLARNTALNQKTVGISTNDCGKEPCKHNRKCQKTGDCPEEQTN